MNDNDTATGTGTTLANTSTTADLLKEAKALQARLLEQAENDVKSAKANVEGAVGAVTAARTALRKANDTLKSVKAAGPRQARKPKTTEKAVTK